MRKPFLTSDQDLFLRNVCRERKAKDAASMLNAEFGTSFTPEQIKGYRTRNHIPSSSTRFRSAELEAFIRNHSDGVGNRELTRLVNEEFGTRFSETQITKFRYSRGYRSGLDTRIKPGQHLSPATQFKKGDIPYVMSRKWDEFMSSESQEKSRQNLFPKGHKPHNWAPVGTERVKSDGYLWRKIAEPNKWKQVHIILWEEKNGLIPEGMCLTFLDGNRMNTALENLLLISRKENRIMNADWNNDRTDNAGMTKAHIGIRRIQTRIDEIEKGAAGWGQETH